MRDAGLHDAAVVAEIYNQSIAAGGACMQDELLSAKEICGWIEGFGDREVILILEERLRGDGAEPSGSGTADTLGDRASRLGSGSPQPASPPAEETRRILGWGIIKRYSERRGYRFTCETAVYLRRDQTGRGLGSRIKKALIARCQALGYHHMVAKILAVNTASIEYNKRLGYEVVGVQKEVGFQDGSWQDVVILQKILERPEPEPTRQTANPNPKES